MTMTINNNQQEVKRVVTFNDYSLFERQFLYHVESLGVERESFEYTGSDITHYILLNMKPQDAARQFVKHLKK